METTAHALGIDLLRVEVGVLNAEVHPAGPATSSVHLFRPPIQATVGSGDPLRERSGRHDAQEADHGHRLLLRTRNVRPRRRGAAEESDEVASLHSIVCIRIES
jgi:hypothetical protein